jgi:hypothetical protein
LSLRITDSYKSEWTGQSWDPAKVKKINDAELECYCRKDSIPYGKDKYLTECKTGVPEENVLFLGASAQSFSTQFLTKLMPYMRTTRTSENREIFLDPASAGPYNGGIVIMDEGTLRIYNEDPERQGKWIGELAIAAVSFGAGKAISKFGANYATRRAAVEGVREAIEEGVEAAGDAAGRRIASLADDAVDALSPQRILKEGLDTVGGAQRNVDDFIKALDPVRLADGATVGGAQKFVDDVVTATRGLDDAAKDTIGRLLKDHSPDMRGGSNIWAFNSYMTYLEGLSPELAARELFTQYPIFSRSNLGNEIVKSAGKIQLTKAGVSTALRSAKLSGFGQGLARFINGVDQLPQRIYGSVARVSIRDIIRNFGPLVAMTASNVLIFDEDPEVKQLSESIKEGLIAGAITVGVSLLLAPLTGGASLALLATEALIVTIGTAWVSQSVDPTKTKVYFESNGIKKVNELVENLVISNDIKLCGRVPEGSSLSFIGHRYSGSDGTIDGWSMTEFIYQSSLCSIGLDWEKIKSGGGFTIVNFIPGGYEVHCKGCTERGWNGYCGETSISWPDGDSKYRSSLEFKPICCTRCLMFDEEFSSYKGFKEGTSGLPERDSIAF